MRVTLTAPDTGRKWKIEPLDNGLCYQMFVTPMKGAKNPRTGKKVKSEWTFTGKYPQDLPHGIKLMIEGMLNDPNGKAEIECDPKHLTKTFKKTMDDYIQKVIDSVTVEMAEFEEQALSTVMEVLGTTEGE